MNTNSNSEAKVALVFGGSRGIGAAAVRRLARDGFAVGFTYVSRPDSAQKVVNAVLADGGHVLSLPADSADATAIRGSCGFVPHARESLCSRYLWRASPLPLRARIRPATVSSFPLFSDAAG